MTEIPIGATGESRLEVTGDVAISFLGSEKARVLATPWLIAHLEMTARNTVKTYLLDSQDTVGTQVNVAHLAATPIGMNVRFRTEIIGVKGRRVTFQVQAFDEKDQVAEGTHERYIIEVEQFAARLEAKRIAARIGSPLEP
jgi:predicted thioesterase